MRLREIHPRQLFLETWRSIARETQASRSTSVFDARPAVAFVVGALVLTALEYLGHSYVYRNGLMHFGFPGTAAEALALSENLPTLDLHTQSARAVAYKLFLSFYELCGLAWWAGWRFLGYFLIPAAVIKWGFGEAVASYGLGRFSKGSYTLYAALYAAVLLAVIAVSYLGEFSAYYPFYELATRSWFDLIVWEALYASQFLALEFFFRGFLLQSARSTLGPHAIFAAIVPYCMIHFGKPWLETLGAIVAGTVLGTLAMGTRSIWGGFLLHVSVAFSMDVAAILQKAELPRRWFPQL